MRSLLFEFTFSFQKAKFLSPRAYGEPNTLCAIDLDGPQYTICNSTNPYTPGTKDQGKWWEKKSFY